MTIRDLIEYKITFEPHGLTILNGGALMWYKGYQFYIIDCYLYYEIKKFKDGSYKCGPHEDYLMTRFL